MIFNISKPAQEKDLVAGRWVRGGGGGDGGRFSRFPLNLLPGNLTICTGLRSQGLEILCGFIGLIDLTRS